MLTGKVSEEFFAQLNKALWELDHAPNAYEAGKAFSNLMLVAAPIFAAQPELAVEFPALAQASKRLRPGGVVVEIEGGIVSRGSTGRVVAKNLNEQIAMKVVQANPAGGTVLVDVVLQDPRWPSSEGWVKMAGKTKDLNGVNIHYVMNTITGAVDDFKFIDPKK